MDLKPFIISEQLTDPTATKESVMQKFLAVALVMNANKTKYESLWKKLENDLLVGKTHTQQPSEQPLTCSPTGKIIIVL